MTTRLESFLRILCIAFLCVVLGGVLVLAKVPPGGLVRDAYRAAVALYDKKVYYGDVYRTNFWGPERALERGVTVGDASKIQPGPTLFTSGHAPKAILVSQGGDVVHEWERAYSTVWDESSAIRTPQPDTHVYFRKADLFPNGDLLAIYEGAGDTPWGYGMVKLDRDSRLLWKFLEPVHHDFDIADDDRIYTLTHEFTSEPGPGLEHLDAPWLEDYLVVLTPDGKPLAKVSLLRAMARSPYQLLLTFVRESSRNDPLHANAVEVIGEKEAAVLPFARRGQVLLSFREPGGGMLALLDVEHEEIVWAARGPWLTQHDPDVLPNGKLLLFDNLGNPGPEGRSRVIEFDPETLEIEWSYTGQEDDPLESAQKCSQQRLANGNTLVTEDDAGRIFEVTREGEIVWQYVNPARGGEDGTLIADVSWAQRIDESALDAEFAARITTGAERRTARR